MTSTSNREKIVFGVAIAFALWALMKLCLGIPSFDWEDVPPTVKDIRSEAPPADVASMIAYPDLESVLGGRRKNPFVGAGGQKPIITTQAIIEAEIDNRGISYDVDIQYEIFQEPVTAMRIRLPANVTVSCRLAKAQASSKTLGPSQILTLKFRNPVKGRQRVPFTLRSPLPRSKNTRIAKIIPLDTRDNMGAIVVSGRDGVKVRVREKSGLRSGTPSGWTRERPKKAHYYSSNDHSMTVELTRPKSWTRNTTAVPQPTPGEFGVILPDVTPTPKFSVGITKIADGKRFATITDPEGRIPLKPYYVGDIIEPYKFKVIRITPSSVEVELPDGTNMEVKEAWRRSHGF